MAVKGSKMFTSIGLLFIFLFVEPSAQMSWRTDPCSIVLSRKSGDDKYFHIHTLPENCTDGRWVWHYPKELISLDFSRPNSNKPFKLCLWSHLGEDSIRRIIDITDEKAPTDLKWQEKQGNESVCLASHGTSLKLEAEGPPNMERYMDVMKYKRTDIEQGGDKPDSQGGDKEKDDKEKEGGDKPDSQDKDKDKADKENNKANKPDHDVNKEAELHFQDNDKDNGGVRVIAGLSSVLSLCTLFALIV